MRHTRNGLSYVKRAVPLLTAPKVRVFALLPALLNIMMAVFVIKALFHYFEHWVHWTYQWLPSWLHWLGNTLWLLYAATLLFFFIYVFNLMANLITAPFNGFLAQAIQQHQGAAIKDQRSLMAIAIGALQRQLQLLAYCLPRCLLGIILCFIPILHLIAPLIWFGLSAWMVALQYCDYAFDNNTISFETMRQHLKAERGLTITFGSTISLLSAIPVVNFIVIPTAVIAATLIYTEHFHDS